MHILNFKSKIHNYLTRYVKFVVPGISTSKNLFKGIENVNSSAAEQCS